MKVLLGNKFFFLNGGSETVFFQEREFLIKQGYTVIDFSMQHPNNFLSDYSQYFVSNIDYHESHGGMIENIKKAFEVARNFIHNKEAVENIKKLLSREKPQIAHLHNIYHQITPAIIPVLKDAGVKVVLTLHDYKLLCPCYTLICAGNICYKCNGKSFYQAMLNKCQDGSWSKSIMLTAEAYWHKWARSYDFVDMYLAPSKYMAGAMARNRIDGNKIVVLHNGIDASKYASSKIDEHYILFFGRIAEEKGVETLIKAYKKLKNKMPLKIVGTGSKEAQLRYQYPDIEFLGYKSGQELNKLISGASFCVVPSECNENCSMTVLESMAYGKPVVGSNIAGIPEQIENGKSGFLFQMGNTEDLANKMSILTENPSLRMSMGKTAREILENKYSLTSHCNQLLRIYKAIA